MSKLKASDQVDATKQVPAKPALTSLNTTLKSTADLSHQPTTPSIQVEPEVKIVGDAPAASVDSEVLE